MQNFTQTATLLLVEVVNGLPGIEETHATLTTSLDEQKTNTQFHHLLVDKGGGQSDVIVAFL